MCNTPGGTVAAIIYLQWPLQYLYNVCYSANLIQGSWCFLFLKIGLFWNQLKSFNSPVHCGPLSSVWTFSELIRAELDHTSKRESVTHSLFYKCANLQKFLSSKSICLNGLNRAIRTQFQIALSSSHLTLIPIWNSIIYLILRDGISMSNGWKLNISSSIWNTSLPFWCSGVIATVGQM
jgi:hypothetical protein